MKARSMLYLIVVLLTLAWSGVVSAQSWVENQSTVTAGDVDTQIDGLLFSNLSSQLGGYCWFQVNKNWAQAYAGPTFSPNGWSQFGVAVGLEQANDPLRYAGFLWLGRERWSFVAIGEDGGSGWWYKSETNFKATNILGVGTIAQRFLGIGLRVELNPIVHGKFWGSVLRDGSKTNYVVGIRFVK